MAVHPDGTRVYVANLSSDMLSVIDPATNTVVATVPVDSPADVAFSPAGDRIYVTNELASTVTVLDATTHGVVATVPVGSLPSQVATTAATPGPRPVISGSTWYVDGTKSRSGPPGTTVVARATGAFTGVPYRLVMTSGGGCRTVVAVLNPAAVWPSPAGQIGRVSGTVPPATEPGTYEVCFRDLTGKTATGVVTFTVA